MKDTYEDILSYPHPVSAVHPQMSRMNRAAQFSPFAALTGYEDAIKEEARYTEEWLEIDEDRKTVLNEKICTLNNIVEKQPSVSITYFQKDAKKEGGSYTVCIGRLRKIDAYRKCIVMQDQTEIFFDTIVDLDIV